jgi:hypothetical protein
MHVRIKHTYALKLNFGSVQETNSTPTRYTLALVFPKLFRLSSFHHRFEMLGSGSGGSLARWQF